MWGEEGNMAKWGGGHPEGREEERGWGQGQEI